MNLIYEIKKGAIYWETGYISNNKWHIVSRHANPESAKRFADYMNAKNQWELNGIQD